MLRPHPQFIFQLTLQDKGQLEEAVSAILSTLFSHGSVRKIQSSAFYLLGTLWPAATRPNPARFGSDESAPLLAFLHSRVFPRGDAVPDAGMLDN